MIRFFEPGRYWVASGTRPDVEHLVDFTVNKPAGACSCEDYQARHARRNREGKVSRCRHLEQALPRLIKDMIDIYHVTVPGTDFQRILYGRQTEIRLNGIDCSNTGCLFKVEPRERDGRYCLLFSDQPPDQKGVTRFALMAFDTGTPHEFLNWPEARVGRS